VASVLVAGLAAAPAPAGATPCTSAFSPSFAADLARRYPGIRVTAAVHDTQTGCWHHLNQGLSLTTASVVKAQVLGAVLLQAQRQGRTITAWERSQIGPMIRLSFNPETSNLYGHVGGVAGMQASDAAFGVRSTSHTATFGLTRSDAVDRTRVALRLLHGGGGLHQQGRDLAWAFLSSVHPLQRWGISAGVPAGWTVAQKNGFYPSSGVGWRVGSSGFVRRDDGDQGYGITVMTEGGGDQATNQRLVEEVSRRAAAHLTVGPAARRPVDRARCTRANAGESWATVTGRLGLPASRAGEVRTVAGGNPSPLSGQRACSPDIPPEPLHADSTIDRPYVPVASDLNCDGPADLALYGRGGAGDSLWRGSATRRFRTSSLAVVGDYVPLTGDFDGDGCGDLIWYGPGTRADTLWSGGSTVASRSLAISGLGYLPRVGDFDADGRDDVLWYRPGSGSDSIWYGTGTWGSFTSVPIQVTWAYLPVVGDLDGDGADDIFFYGPGADPDSFWKGRPGQRSFQIGGGVSVTGRYRPVAGDVDGDGADELIWYAPGAAPDVRWDGLPTQRTDTPLRVERDYLPVAADFDGDGYDDLAWYGLAGQPESIWWGRASGFLAGPLRLR
jgi:hypothetical protein